MDIDESCLLTGTPEQVYRLMCDEDFQRRKAKRLDALEFAMSISAAEDSPREVRTQRLMATQLLPEFVKSLVSPTMRVTELEVWHQIRDDHFSGDFSIDVDGAPIYLRGSVQIQAVPNVGSRVRFTGKITATAPLFKTRVAEASAESIIETIRTEFDVLGEELGIPQDTPAA